MKQPAWITEEECLAVHDALLVRHGGLPGVRDMGLLGSALHRPIQLLLYGKPSMFDLAAAYASGIIKNHPFNDGNKRAGFVVAALFLESNGEKFTATEESVIVTTLALAAGELGEKEYAAWLKASCRQPRAASKRTPRGR